MICCATALLLGTLVAAQDGTVLRRSTTFIPEQLDPQRYASTTQRVLLTDLFAGLTTLNGEDRIMPAVAKRWEISDDGKRYRFFLRTDAFWHDGTPVTAHDFVLSFTRLQSFGSSAFQLPLYRDIMGIETEGEPLGAVALDDHTLEFTLSQPFTHFLRVLSRPAAFPVPRHRYAELGDDWANPDNIIGNGAYRMQNHTAGEEIVLAKSGAYYGAESVQIPEVRYVRLQDRNLTLRTTLSEGLDVSATLEQRQLATAAQLENYRLYSQERPNIVFLYINTGIPELQNEAVRQAIYLVTDSATIIKANGFDFEPIESLMPPMATYSSAVRKPPVDMDAINQARQLMESAGYSPDKRLALKLRTDFFVGRRFAVSLRRQYEDVFIDLEIIPPRQEGDYGLAIRSWTLGYPDPEYFLRLFVNMHNRRAPESLRFDVESAFQRARANPAEFNKILGGVEMQLMQNYPAVPLYSAREHRIVAKRVKNWSALMGVDNQSRWLRLE